MRSISTIKEVGPLENFVPLDAPEKRESLVVPRLVITRPPEDVESHRALDCEESIDDVVLPTTRAEPIAEMQRFATQLRAEEEELLQSQEALLLQLKQRTLLYQMESLMAQNALHQQLIQGLCAVKGGDPNPEPVMEDVFVRRKELKDRERSAMEESGRPVKRARTFEHDVETIDDNVVVYLHKHHSLNRLAIYNLNGMTTPETLFKIMSEFGRIQSVLLLKSPSRTHSTTAFVEFTEEVGAQTAYRSLSDVTIDGSKIGFAWSPSKFDRRARNLKVVYTRKTSSISPAKKATLFDRKRLSMKFGNFLDSFSKSGSDRVFLRFSQESAAMQAYKTFSKMGFDVHYSL